MVLSCRFPLGLTQGPTRLGGRSVSRFRMGGMGRRSARAMDRARASVTRLLTQGVSVEQTARKAGVTPQTVRVWQKAETPQKIVNSDATAYGPEVIPQKITWGEALGNAWDSRRGVRGLETYRALLKRWANSFAELIDPAPDPGVCRVCLPSDLERSPCPGHGPVTN